MLVRRSWASTSSLWSKAEPLTWWVWKHQVTTGTWGRTVGLWLIRFCCCVCVDTGRPVGCRRPVTKCGRSQSGRPVAREVRRKRAKTLFDNDKDFYQLEKTEATSCVHSLSVRVPAGRQSWWRGRARWWPWRSPNRAPSTTDWPLFSTSPVPWCREVNVTVFNQSVRWWSWTWFLLLLSVRGSRLMGKMTNSEQPVALLGTRDFCWHIILEEFCWSRVESTALQTKLFF